MFAKTLLVFVVISLALALLVGAWLLRTRSLALTPDKLRYPCLRIYDGRIWERIANEAELRSTPSNYYMNRKDDPLLIDSEFRVATLSKLKMVGSELGLLVTGPRPIEIEFEIEIRPDISAQQARGLVEKLIRKAEPGPSQAPSDSIQNAASLAELIELLHDAALRPVGGVAGEE
jgi:hypothetical protein